jgi:hypothetical protein
LRRLLSAVAGIAVVGAVLGANVPTVGAAVADWYHHYQITRPAYEAKYGLWTELNVPSKFRVNGIHSTLLYNGDVLIMAGSGNDQAFFNAGTFKTLLLNPETADPHAVGRVLRWAHRTAGRKHPHSRGHRPL